MLANCLKIQRFYVCCLSFNRMPNLTPLDHFNLEISQNELYPKDSKWVDKVLHEMATRRIVRVGEFYDGVN